MKVSVPQSESEFKAFLVRLDRHLLDRAIELAVGWYKALLEQVDRLIARLRDRRLSITHLREVEYQTCLGRVRVKRRQYRDLGGRYRYLLDEFLGMGGYGHATVVVQELASELAAAMPYRRSAQVLKKTSAIDLSHQTIWRAVAKLADGYLKKAHTELKRFVETGEIPEGEGRKAAQLLVEADGVYLSLQREKARKAEVKLGIAYEGWEKVGKDRYRTVNKTTYADVAGENVFWEAMTLKLGKKYDLSRVGRPIVGGDGAEWVKKGASYIGGRFQLDRYHLNRELTQALGLDKATKRVVWQACECGQVEVALAVLAEAGQRSRGEEALRIARAYRYLSENKSGIGDYRLELGEAGKHLRRTGAIEGSVDKFVVRRMKNQGMSWKVKGIRRLLCLRSLVLEGRLGKWLLEVNQQQSAVRLPEKKVRHLITRCVKPDHGRYLASALPALTGPHASRPWVRALKTLAETA